MRVRNIKDITTEHHRLHRNTKPTSEEVAEAYKASVKRGLLLDEYGRCYARFLPAPPKGMRYDKTGKLVPRFSPQGA